MVVINAADHLQVRKELIEEKGIPVEAADFLGKYVLLKGEPMEMLRQLRENSLFVSMLIHVVSS